jgi:general secretion pathway protein D
MALNNQTAMLKVVENLVYFEVDSDTTQNTNNTLTTVTTTAKTVPVGFIMAVTPQIAEDESITLVVRPTISRFVKNVADPNPNLGLVNNVPQIETREMESVLRLDNGQIAVLGGLMTDTENRDSDGLPGVSEVKGVGELFKYRDDQVAKTELVIFIRPLVVREPSIDKDLYDFRPFLDKAMSAQPTSRVSETQP